MMNILITSAYNSSNDSIEKIEKMGYKVSYIQDERFHLEKYGLNPSTFQCVICNSLFLYNKIEDFTNLKYIQLTSAGYDRVPMDYIKKNNIQIKNAKGVYSIPIAEYVVSNVLQMYKHSDFFRQNQAEHQWIKNRNLEELFGKQILIIGTGSIGTECAKRFKAFGCVVVGVNRTVHHTDDFDYIYPMDYLEQILPQSDVVVLALPLSDETFHIIDEETLSLFKNDAIIANVSRGAVVDTKAFVKALKSGTIRGGILDVFEEEPLPPESELWDMENVIITPHNSFEGDGNKQRLQSLVESNLAEWIHV